MALLTRSDVDFVDDEATAARLYLELQDQLANPGLPTGARTESKAALNKLLRTWPEADDLAAELTDDELGGLSPALKRRQRAHREGKGITAQDARNRRAKRRREQDRPASTPTGDSRPPASRGARPSRRRGGRSGRLVGPRARRAAEHTGIPASARDTGRLIMRTLGLLLGLSLLYLLLTNSQRAAAGRSAVEQVTRGVANAVSLLVAPINPFDAAQRAGVLGRPAPAPAGAIDPAPIVGGVQGIAGAFDQIAGKQLPNRRPGSPRPPRRPSHSPRPTTP